MFSYSRFAQVTKADEYAEALAGCGPGASRAEAARRGLPIDAGCHAMLVCRIVGGQTRVVDTHEYDKEQLQTTYHVLMQMLTF